MSEQFDSPFPESSQELAACRLSDETATPRWRGWDPHHSVPLGRARRDEGSLVFSISPGEWIAIGDRPGDGDFDLTHVRAMLRLTGPGAGRVLGHVCAIDLGDDMTPNGGAARTLVAGVAAELVRDDVAHEPSYLVLISRSFATHVWERLVAVGQP